MNDIRLPTAEYELAGKTYKLTANMNVLADVQEAFDGDLREALSRKHSFRTGLVVGAAMLNEANAVSGGKERFTAEDLGRMIAADKAADFAALVIGLLLRSVKDEENEAENGDEKN